MPSTSARLVSPRQQAFVASLAAERVVPADCAGAVLAAANGSLESRSASRLIARLMDAPRSAPAASAQDGTSVPRPSADTRPGRMLLAGGIEATATLANGEHVTVTIRTRKRSGRGWANAALGEEGSRTNVSILGRKVGWINVDADGGLLLTLRTRRQDFVVAITEIFAYAAGLSIRGDVSRIQEASRCGRCFRTLTDPVSIDRGIGPECFGRDTGSQHVAAERELLVAAADAAVAPTNAGQSLEEWGGMVDEGRAQEDRMHAAFAEAEQAAERAAYEAEMEQERRLEMRAATTSDEGIAGDRARQLAALETVADALSIPVAPAGFVPERRPSADVARARDLIAEALDSYFGEPELSFALGIFDQLASR
jgi:hypothetical protein